KSTGSIRICPDRGWAAQGSVEGVGKPLGGLPVTVADDGDHVEAAGRQVAAPAHGEVVLCRAADPAALAVVDGLGGVTELDAATQAYLDEHEHGVVAHDQVDLARARGIVGLDQLEPLALEVSAGMALGPGAVGEVARGHRSCPVRPARAPCMPSGSASPSSKRAQSRRRTMVPPGARLTSPVVPSKRRFGLFFIASRRNSSW